MGNMTERIGRFQHFFIEKKEHDRLTLLSEVIKADHERAALFKILLAKRPEVLSVKVDDQTGRVSIKLADMDIEPVYSALETILSNIEKKPRVKAKLESPQQFDQLKELSLLVEGMSCPACAALIEIAFKRLPTVKDVDADLDSKRVRILGQLSNDEAILLIEKLGYTHIVEDQ